MTDDDEHNEHTRLNQVLFLLEDRSHASSYSFPIKPELTNALRLYILSLQRSVVRFTGPIALFVYMYMSLNINQHIYIELTRGCVNITRIRASHPCKKEKKNKKNIYIYRINDQQHSIRQIYDIAAQVQVDEQLRLYKLCGERPTRETYLTESLIILVLRQLVTIYHYY